MERIKGKDVIFYIDNNQVFFCTNLQCMRVVNASKNNTKGKGIEQVIDKIRARKIKSTRSIYMELGVNLTCISVAMPIIR